MPGGPKQQLEATDKVVQLHSVHFIGDLYRQDGQDKQGEQGKQDKQGEFKLYRKDTDVCSELDLMSIVAHADGSFTCFAIGNIKVTSASAAANANNQNAIAQSALNSYMNKQPFDFLDAKKAVIKADVKAVFGFVIGSNKRIPLEKIKLADAPESNTIGAKEATGDLLPLSLSDL